MPEERGFLQELEAALARVRGVAAARVVAGDSGEIQEVHVLATPERPAKQVVRDVESVLATLFRLHVDHRKISVAQVNPESDPGRGAGNAELSLFAVSVSSRDLRCTVNVQLRLGDYLYEGVASGPDSPRQRLRLAAAAAVQAVEEYTGGGVPLAVEDVQEVALGPRTVVVVSVARPSVDGGDCLVGTAVVQHDPVEAVARAVLDAVHRQPAGRSESARPD